MVDEAPDDLKQCAEKLRRLKIDIAEVDVETLSLNDKLLLLDAQQSLRALVRHMRRQQGALKQKQSQATAATQVAQAYVHAAGARQKES
ncbi:hypothetical protein SAMN04515647_1991 [Cohaesibacter sp. ES.047]|uniref:hypothetical protein n=1 Tax=Cohaesibacter sp. ES.047 TaxID=1798205 RepID=UPI000BB78761|nr:hypothetical protein [Cohaesibacter sp. ES.047]SNY91751.1 hypothetical protein SAMN04515647_1991 [Cohaesibacter sp. ES.047]